MTLTTPVIYPTAAKPSLGLASRLHQMELVEAQPTTFVLEALSAFVARTPDGVAIRANTVT
jgi:hypothetical protein